MLNNLNREIFGIGEIIFNEGDAGDCAYLIEGGIVEIFVLVDGREKSLNRIGRGELFGEVALIDRQPRTAAARAVDKVVLVTIERKLMNELLDKTDPIVRHLLLLVLE